MGMRTATLRALPFSYSASVRMASNGFLQSSQ
jgi:hypothetical protein